EVTGRQLVADLPIDLHVRQVAEALGERAEVGLAGCQAENGRRQSLVSGKGGVRGDHCRYAFVHDALRSDDSRTIKGASRIGARALRARSLFVVLRVVRLGALLRPAEQQVAERR